EKLGFDPICIECNYYINVNCGFIPEEITHEAHPDHILSRCDRDRESMRKPCLAEGWDYGSEIYFSCGSCDFYLHSGCALFLPGIINHKLDKHPMKLTYGPVENHKSEYFCVVCEEKLNPNVWFYHCHECAYSLHTRCAPLIVNFEAAIRRRSSLYYYLNIKFGGTYNIKGHEHSVSLAIKVMSRILFNREVSEMPNLSSWHERLFNREVSEMQAPRNALGMLFEIVIIILSSNPDSWRWSLHPSGQFSVSAFRAIIDSKLLWHLGSKIRWNNLVPGKINILAWRIRNYRMPARANIDKRGIDIHSILCPFCEEQIEDEDHIFALCPFSRNIWDLIRKWWGLDVIPLDTALNVLEMADDGDLNFGEKISSLFDVVVLCAIWWIWRARNLLVFQAVKISSKEKVDDHKKLKKEINSKLCEIDECIDNGLSSTSDMANRV
ncbi:zinc finger, PHD-type containing protein, partial [Tanacetum coccineum]